MDIKGIAVYVGALFIGDLNASLQAVGLIANIFYIAYQYKVLKKKETVKNDEQDNKG